VAGFEPTVRGLRICPLVAGSVVWEREQDGAANTWSGVLSTATGLVFFGDDNGDFAAVDARTGQRLCRFAANTIWRASPMAYAVGGQQFIAVAAGGSIFAFGL
jgi:alcohol dehydrogenase (cytochrome c)